jgi:hypothetical protein
MIKLKPLGCALLLIGIASAVGYPVEAASEYVAPE